MSRYSSRTLILTFLVAQVSGVVNLPPGWTEVGCFSDLSTTRTLQAASTSNDEMTVEQCMSICSNYVFAGVEFGQECYCDSTIQLPGMPVNSTGCSSPCVGNATETCGGVNHIQIFTNGKPGPIQPPEIDTDAGGFLSRWNYTGCYADSPNSRVLATPVAVQNGPSTCIEACLEAGFSLAGTEAGRECWCDGHTDPDAGVGDQLGLKLNGTQVPDTDCRAVCVGDHSVYCGNDNRIAVYSMTSHETPPPQPPLNCGLEIGNFSLVARTSTGEVMPLKAVTVEMVPSVMWTVLSACPLCCNEYQTFGLGDFLTPRSIVNPNQFMFSINTAVGESPTFMAPTVVGAGPLPTNESYCFASGSSAGEPLLTYQTISDGFALCRNNSLQANGRLDVVFQPIDNHPNYIHQDCQSVVIGRI